MGVCKHKDGARTKSSANYKQKGQREINKAKKQERLAEGKKIKSRKTPKTMDMIRDTLIRNLQFEQEPENPEEKANWLPPKKSLGKNLVR